MSRDTIVATHILLRIILQYNYHHGVEFNCEV